MRSKYLDKLLMGHLDINSIRNIFDAFPANIRLDEDVLKTSFVFVFRRRLDQDEYVCLSLNLQKTSSRRLGQDQYIRLGYTSSRRLQDVFKTSSRRLAKTSSRHLQDVFKTSCKNVFKTSSRRLRHVLKKSSRCLQDIFKTSCKGVFKTLSRRIIKLYCSC